MLFSGDKKEREVFLWAGSFIGRSNLIVSGFGGTKKFYKFDFPVHPGDLPKKISLPTGKEEEVIIVKPPGSALTYGGNLRKVISPQSIEVYERVETDNPLPIRFGLTDGEKKIALDLARGVLRRYLNSGKIFSQDYLYNLSKRFYLKTDVGIALWVEGHLRGSQIIEGYTLGEGIVKAILRAAKDARFKPISKREIMLTRIEITIIGDLKILLSENEMEKNEIYHSSGYRLNKNGRTGWLLPEIFNVRKFKNLSELFKTLGEEKAGLTEYSAKYGDITIFGVDDFIESEKYSRVLSLIGPVIKKNYPTGENVYKKIGSSAAEWLMSVQEEDGNIPPVINPITGQIKQVDWVRLSLSAWALSEFGNVVSNKNYLEAACLSFKYLSENIFLENFLISDKELSWVYFGRLALSLGKNSEAFLVASKVSGEINSLRFEPILFSQVAGFLKEVSNLDKSFHPQFKDMASILKNRFKFALKTNMDISLAAWAELVNTFSNVDQRFSEEVLGWLKKYQRIEGSFQNTSNSEFSYTRGTGKIFEVMAVNKEKNEVEITKALEWLYSMQYDTENVFFIPRENRNKIIGGFRHDYFNQDVWVDSSAHILLGISKVISRIK